MRLYVFIRTRQLDWGCARTEQYSTDDGKKATTLYKYTLYGIEEGKGHIKNRQEGNKNEEACCVVIVRKGGVIRQYMPFDYAHGCCSLHPATVFQSPICQVGLSPAKLSLSCCIYKVSSTASYIIGMSCTAAAAVVAAAALGVETYCRCWPGLTFLC